MKKAFDQTVRDLKRGVNKKVLKVPSIEQKVLDATNNEPWGPHGSLLADIAQATKNYHEYHMIMSIIWKRINDTGKNWRHVYKGLIVLEYLVGHGSERVIDDIKEHSYQISALSDFQYIDSSARDQGSNVRRKSQALVVLVNDKERIQEAREKAANNRDKFRGPSSTGGMYKPGTYSSTDDDRYDGRYNYERDREWGYREDDRSSRNGDPYGRDIDRYSRDSDERRGRENYRDDDHSGRSRSVDPYQNGSRSRSAERDRAYEDDGQYSSRGTARAESQCQDGSRQVDRKYSEQSFGAPPSYEEAVCGSRSPAQNDRDGENSVASAPTSFAPPPISGGPNQSMITADASASPVNKGVEAVDEFDPRISVTASLPTSNSAEMDLLGSLPDTFASNVLAIMPAAASGPTSPVADAPTISGSGTSAGPQSTSSFTNQPFGDPFGDSPFKAFPSTNNAPSQYREFASSASFQGNMNPSTELPQPVASNLDAATTFGFGDSLPAITYAISSVPDAQLPSGNAQYSLQELTAPAPPQDTEFLEGILPPSAVAPPAFPAATTQPAPFGPSLTVAPQITVSVPTRQPTQPSSNVYGSFHAQAVLNPSVASHSIPQTQGGPDAQYYDGNILPRSASMPPMASQFAPQQAPIESQQHFPTSVDSLASVPKASKDKFDPKSTVWADTLSRGLVNLNISGAKINPLADIGIDFDSINRKEKRMDKQAAAHVTSSVTMGKAMGSGSGLGRAGSGILRPPQNPMMGAGTGVGGMGMSMGRGMASMGMAGGAGMGMGMGGGPSTGVSLGSYGGMNQQPVGMNISMGQGAQIQHPTGMPPGSMMPGAYHPAMGGNYPAQQTYGGRY